MGKRRIEIEKIEDRKKLNVTFTKRRQGLFKKANELSVLCNSQVAVLVFSSSGKPYVYGDLQNLTNRYYSNSHNFNFKTPLSSSSDHDDVDDVGVDENQTNNNNNNCTIVTTTTESAREVEEKDEEMNLIAMEEEKEEEEEENDDDVDDDDEIWYWEDAETMGSSIDRQHNEFDHHQTYDDHHDHDDNVVAVNPISITNSLVVTEEDRERSEAEKEKLSIHDFATSNGFDFDISNREEEEEELSVCDFDSCSGFDFGISNREEENYCTGDRDGYLYSSSSSRPWQDEIAALLSAELPPPLCY